MIQFTFTERDTEDGEENFCFDIITGKCLNQKDFGFGGKEE